MGFHATAGLLLALALAPAPVAARERLTDGLGHPRGYSETTERGTRYTDPLGHTIARCNGGECRDAENRVILRTEKDRLSGRDESRSVKKR